MARSRPALWGVFLLVSLLAGCGGGNWLTTRDGRCQVYDPHPLAGQTLVWEGECVGGRAQGPGRLRVYEPSGLRYSLEGYMQAGLLTGVVVFSSFADGRLIGSYAEDWANGRRSRRLRNLVLERSLAEAPDARAYLFRLASYRGDNPDAWLDGFHEALAERTVFVARDYDLRRPCSQRDVDLGAVPPDAGGTCIMTGAVLADALLFKIYDRNSAESYRLYSIHNHPVADLRRLVTDRYLPGGEQFFVDALPPAFVTRQVPSRLPRRYAPVRASGKGRLTWRSAVFSGQPRWQVRQRP